MKKEFKITKSITIEEGDLSDLLANALLLSDGGCAWWKEENPDDYKKAKEELISEGMKEPYMEDVWARMLFNGGRLKLLDPESDWHWKGHKKGELLWMAQVKAEGSEPVGGKWHLVSLSRIVKAIQKYGDEHCGNDCGADLKAINENGDSIDADCVIQIAMYGEIVYE